MLRLSAALAAQVRGDTAEAVAQAAEAATPKCLSRVAMADTVFGWRGRTLVVQVGDHRLADRRSYLGQPFGERDRPARAGQFIDDPEAEGGAAVWSRGRRCGRFDVS
jgi:hypothetical protein